MMEPLAIAASLAGLVSLGTSITLSLIRFFTSYIEQDSELDTICDNLKDLSDLFHHLRIIVDSRDFKQDEITLIKTLERWIEKAVGLIQRLEDKCQKFQKPESNTVKSTAKRQSNRLTYYFQKDALVKLNRNIAEAQNTLSLTLDLLNARDNQHTQRNIEEIKALVDLVRIEQTSSSLCAWLKAPDAMIEHNKACAKKHPGTGLWFIKSPQFLSWLTEGNSIIWLNGFAGSGKSVLCSTAIEFLFRRSSVSSKIGVAFFYFSFSDQSKQDEIAILRALLIQLSSQLKNNHKHLQQLKKRHGSGTPPASVLIQYLRRLCEEFSEIFLAIDALDECLRDGPRQSVLDLLKTIRKWEIPRLHMLITSRNEPDIGSCLGLPTSQQVLMENIGLNQDISKYIESRLDTDCRLLKWHQHRDRIAKTLSEKAKGMFKWVECQLFSLQFCPRSEDHLDRLLSSLPPTLAKTYERIFRNIDPSLIEDARRILTLLCFTSRPLRVSELIEGIAVDVNHQPARLNRRRRLEDHQDILFICPILVDIYPSRDQTFWMRELPVVPFARIAHHSVQQYLVSSYTRLEKPAEFNLDSFTAYKEILHICLTYLLNDQLWDLCQSVLEKGFAKIPEESSKVFVELEREYPLACFAAREWCLLYKKISRQTDELDPLVLKLFEEQRSLQTCIILENPSRNMLLGFMSFKNATPIYYASYWGLTHVLKIMTGLASSGTGTDGASSSGLKVDTCCDINADGPEGPPLTVAISEGHAETVRLLLDMGADVNAPGENSLCRPLHVAVFKGDEELVHELLKKGAKFPRSSARLKGNERISRLLREYGVDQDDSLEVNRDPIWERYRNHLFSKEFELVVKDNIATHYE